MRSLNSAAPPRRSPTTTRAGAWRPGIRWRCTIAATRCALLGREPDAIAAYDRALAAAPQHLNAWLNRGLALAALNRHQDAVASYGRALALQPDFADAHFNAAMSLLTIGDYARGFAEYEWRWKRTGMAVRKEFRRPAWLGELPLAGKTILLHAEQGLGDTVQFVRYVPRLAGWARAWCSKCRRR